LAGPAVSRLDDSCIEGITFTNTVPTQGERSDKFEVLSVAQLFAKAIRHIHDGDAISALFR
jgi:ribose-phosphate pyrophosphokinase